MRTIRTRAVWMAAGLAFTMHATRGAAGQVAASGQVTAVFDPTKYTGRLNELATHVPINHVGKVYEVRRGNVLIATYAMPIGQADANDPNVTASTKYIPVSTKCSYPGVVTFPEVTPGVVPDGCRRDLALGRAKLIKAGTRVTLADIEPQLEASRVNLTLLEHHKEQSGTEAPRFLSRLTLQFPAGFLATADVAKVAAEMKRLLAPSGDPILMQPSLADAPSPAYTLEDRLSGAYTATAFDLNEGSAANGAVLHVKADRFLRGLPQRTPAMGCVLTIKDQRAKDPGFMCKALAKGQDQAQTAVFVHPADDLTLRSVKVDTKKDKDVVRLELDDVTQNGYYGVIDFEFAKGSLGSDDVRKVSDEIASVFTVERPAETSQPGVSVAGGVPPGEATDAMNTAVPLPPAGPPQTLEEQLRSIYKMTVVDHGAVTVRGTALTVANAKVLLGTPYATPTVCPATVVEGAPKPPTASCTTPLRTAIAKHDARYFAAGERLDVISIAVNTAAETVTFGLIDDASLNAAPRLHTAVDFVFPKGYLEGSDAGQVGELINTLLPMADPNEPASRPVAAVRGAAVEGR